MKKYIKKYVAVALSSTLLFVNIACKTSGEKVDVHNSTNSIVLPDHFKYPNGITHNSKGELFVGSVVSGDILKIDTAGNTTLFHKNSKTVFAGTSLRLDDKSNILWVASPDFLGKKINGNLVKRPHRIAALNAKNGSEIWSSELPDQGFANDFALDGEGGVYVTDTVRDLVYHLTGPNTEFRIVSRSSLFSPGVLGPAGIANFNNKKLIIGLYSDGRLVEVGLNKEKRAEKVRYLPLERRIENPDGLIALNDNQLLILEGASINGDGKILKVDLNSKAPYKITVLKSGIKSPLNLTMVGESIYISEGNIRHLVIKDQQLEIPTEFNILLMPFVH